MLYAISITACLLLCKLFYGMKVIGKENLPKKGCFIITPNHTSAMDVLMVATGRYTGKRLVILAKEELFKTKFLQWYFTKMGAVAVRRGKGDNTVLEKAIERVKNGTGALVFPEGTRSHNDELGKFKSGAFIIAAQAKADIVPCRIIYSSGKPKLFGKCTVVFGEIIKFEELNLNENYSASALRNCKDLLRKRLEQLFDENKKKL